MYKHRVSFISLLINYCYIHLDKEEHSRYISDDLMQQLCCSRIYLFIVRQKEAIQTYNKSLLSKSREIFIRYYTI